MDTSHFLPAAPAPSYTQPTTRYVSRQPLPANAAAADAAALRPQPPHWPLVIMLTLLPMAVGCQAVAAALFQLSPDSPVTYYVTKLGWLAGAAGLGASVFHLGQPRRAWRIFLGWRKSWLSREAMAFGAWFGAATTATVVANGWSPVPLPLAPLLGVTTLLGLIGLVCSVMIYVDTHRVFWRLTQTAPRFLGSAVVLGLASALAAGGPPGLALALMLTTLAKLALEARALAPLRDLDENNVPSAARQTARLLTGPLLAPVNTFRVCAALFGGILIPLMIVADSSVVPPAWCALVLLLPGELAERCLFFRAVDAPKMPGLPGR